MRIFTTYYTLSGWPVLSILPDWGREYCDGKPIGERIKRLVEVYREGDLSDDSKDFLVEVISGLMKTALFEKQINPNNVIKSVHLRSPRDEAILSEYLGLDFQTMNRALNITFYMALKKGYGNIRPLTSDDIDIMHENLMRCKERLGSKPVPILLFPVTE